VIQGITVVNMHGPDRRTLPAGACKQRNEAGFQSYLQRCLNLHSSRSQNPKLLNSGPDNEPKFTLDITSHPEDLWEHHSIRTSAINLTAPRFNFEETRNMEGNCLRVNNLQSPSRIFPPEFQFGAHSPSPVSRVGVTLSTSYVAEGTIFNLPALDESNTDIDTRRRVRAPGAIPSTDTCSLHSSDPTPRVIHTKLPRFGGEEDAADNRLALILATNRLSIRDAARRSNVWRAHLVCVGDDGREYCKTSRVSLDKLSQSHIGDTGETSLW